MTAIDKTAFDELPDGILVADDTGRVVVLNPAAERILGLTADSSIGLDFREAVPLTDEQGRDWWACTDPYNGLPSRTRQPERVLQLPDGRDVLVTAGYVRGEDRRLLRLVVSFRDTHARERLELSRGNLVSTVAHELRSPLTSVKGFTATLLAKWDRFNDEQKKLMLTTVNADADRVTRLITELLDVSRIDAGRLELRRQVVDLPALVAKAVAGRVASGEPEDRFVISAAPGLPEIWADPDKMDQVLSNLVENAIRHGDGTVTITIGPFLDGVEVTVADEGEGIADAVASRVFTRFWRGGNRRGGTGLGLYIVKGLVEAHGGRVEVGRAPSGGAAFRFELPAGTPSFI
ncbi:MAG: ATP-binding protein [Actinomycetota bacterium]|nr:ATP-binding protein [Actinomycetota bacterium]